MWPATDPRVTADTFKEGVTSLREVEAAWGKSSTYKPNENHPGEYTATWHFDHGGPNPEGVNVVLAFGADGKMTYKLVHTTYLK
jgi:hypothetical protein